MYDVLVCELTCLATLNDIKMWENFSQCNFRYLIWGLILQGNKTKSITDFTKKLINFLNLAIDRESFNYLGEISLNGTVLIPVISHELDTPLAELEFSLQKLN